MSNSISDPGKDVVLRVRAADAVTARALLKGTRRMHPHPEDDCGACRFADAIDAALSAPENNSGAEKAVEVCRREFGEDRDYERCGKPAEFIVWGKLFPREALGPRCYDCAAEQVGHNAVRPGNPQMYAIYKLPTTQPVLLSDEDRERIDAAFDRLAGFVPAGRDNLHLNCLRKLAQQHYGVEGADRG